MAEAKHPIDIIIANMKAKHPGMADKAPEDDEGAEDAGDAEEAPDADQEAQLDSIVEEFQKAVQTDDRQAIKDALKAFIDVYTSAD